MAGRDDLFFDDASIAGRTRAGPAPVRRPFLDRGAAACDAGSRSGGLDKHDSADDCSAEAPTPPGRRSGGGGRRGGKGKRSRLHVELTVLARLAAETQDERAKKLAAQGELLLLAQRLWGPQVRVWGGGGTVGPDLWSCKPVVGANMARPLPAGAPSAI